jgi:hypothetical protein
MTCTDAQFESVIALISGGMNTRKACESVGVKFDAFQYRLRAGGNEESQRHARATEQRADLWVEETVDIAGDTTIDPNRARNMILARQWAAPKYNKRFNERIDLNVSQSLDITAILTDARARLRPVCDQLPMIDAEVIETKQLTSSGATDNESDAPDIFS